MKLLSRFRRWQVAAAVAVLGALGLTGAQGGDRLKLGVMAGVEEEIAEVAKTEAARNGLEVELITFSDYAMPNAALAAGDIDANAFQHKPYLDAQIAARGYRIVPIGYTIVEPIGVYSKRVATLAQLRPAAKIGIPNDPSNGDRALRLLANSGLIALRDIAGRLASPLDIAANPKRLQFVELEAAQLPRALVDFDAAVINTNYVVSAGLDPTKDALVQEPRQNNPYANIIAVREKERDRAVLRALVAAYQSPRVGEFLATRFKGAILPAW